MCMYFMRLHRFVACISFISCSSSFVMLRLSLFSFCFLALSVFCSSVGITSSTTSTMHSPSLISYLMCAFPYLPLSVLVMLTSVVLASSIVIWCMMLTRSALNIDPLRFPFLYVFSSALDVGLIFPLFDPTSSSSALAPLYFNMVTTLFVMIVNNLSWAGSCLFVVSRLRLFSWLLFLWSSAECACDLVLLILVGVLYCVGFSVSLIGLFPFCFSVSPLLLILFGA